jgi:hypothetical protein
MSGMLVGDPNSGTVAARIIEELGNHALTKSHARHISIERCRHYGLVVEELESNSELQEAVLSVHHSYVHTFSGTTAVKIIENHEGVAFINMPNL